MDWIKDRLKEPSTWGAAAGVSLAVGVLSSIGWFVWLGIIFAIAGFVLKENQG
jgi:hypothetical protein|tara:strand:- start:977 stop:1135 length:159 start_codon:yes stop_codon:yes gene_type:complete